MALTCDRCLKGDHFLCKKQGCPCEICRGNIRVTGPSEAPKIERVRAPKKKTSKRSRGPQEGKKGSPGAPRGPRGVDEATIARIEWDLVHTTLTYPQIALAHGVTYEQVRTVKRDLEQAGEHVPERVQARVTPLDVRVTILEREVAALKEALLDTQVQKVQERVREDGGGQTTPTVPILPRYIERESSAHRRPDF